MTPKELMETAKSEAQGRLDGEARIDHVSAEWSERRAFARWVVAYSLPGQSGDCNVKSYANIHDGATAPTAGAVLAERILQDIAASKVAEQTFSLKRDALEAKALADAVHWQAIPERFSQTHIWAVNDRLIEIEDLEDETAYLFDDADIEAWREDPGARVIVGHACWTKQLARAFRDDPVRQAAEQLHDMIGLFDDGDTPEYLVDALAEAWKAYNDALTEDESVCWYEATTQAVYMLARELLALAEE